MAVQIIVTSYLFPNAEFSQERLDGVLKAGGGDKEKLVIDLSCRRQGEKWIVAMNKWQTLTDMELNAGKAHLSMFLLLSTETSSDRVSRLH